MRATWRSTFWGSVSAAALVTGCVSGTGSYVEYGGPPETVAASTAAATTPTAKAPGPFDKPGFLTTVVDGRLWVFREGSKDLAAFVTMGPSDKHVSRIGAGPGGMTLKGPDAETLVEYVVAKDGFATEVTDGRLWVFRAGSPEHEEFKSMGPSDKHSTRIGAGPMGMTVKGPDLDTVNAYLTAKKGFHTEAEDGRLWVYREGSKELAEYKAMGGHSDKHASIVGAGPGGLTLKGPDAETILEYLVAVPGFYTTVIDRRVWVFRADSEELASFRQHGPSDKHSTRVGAGPLRMTVKGPDLDTIDAYVRAAGVRPRRTKRM